MFSYEFYKVMHIVGIVGVFMALASISAYQTSSTEKPPKVFGILHGLGLFFILLAGFGLMARLKLMGVWPHWITAKLVVWFTLGGMIALVKRVEFVKKNFWMLGLGLIFIASYLAVYKPF